MELKLCYEELKLEAIVLEYKRYRDIMATAKKGYDFLMKT